MRAPDGAEWEVRRRWLDRPLPDLRRRFQEHREEGADENSLEAIGFIDFADNIWVGIVLTVLVVLVAFVLLPVIGVALELILLVFLLGSGLVGRVVLRRPWTVEAINLDEQERSASYAVKGWRRSGRAAAEIAATIAAAGPPERIAEGLKVS